MAAIVSLREKSSDELEAMLEDALEEQFNLRFQQASARLKDVSQLGKVRADIAQIKTVLNERRRAAEAAAAEPAIAAVLAGKEWQADTHFDYEESAWLVAFEDEGGQELATAKVNLNRKVRRSRRKREALGPANLVISYETAG